MGKRERICGKTRIIISTCVRMTTLLWNWLDFISIPCTLILELGIVSCQCCGDNLLEIKCPYSKRDLDIKEVVDELFYIVQSEEGQILSHKHQYYYQIRVNWYMWIKYCGFVCWSPKGIYKERITFDPKCYQSLKNIFRTCYLTKTAK